MKIAITGHRPHRLGNDYELTSQLILNIKKEIIKIIDIYHTDKLISGVALGIDTLFALIAIEKEIPFIAAIPFEGQERKWPKSSQDKYNSIINHPLCDKHIVSEGGYAAWKMQKRNEWMVDNADLLICVWNGEAGGTSNCVKYAKSKNKEMIRINPRDYDAKSA